MGIEPSAKCTARNGRRVQIGGEEGFVDCGRRLAGGDQIDEDGAQDRAAGLARARCPGSMSLEPRRRFSDGRLPTVMCAVREE